MGNGKEVFHTIALDGDFFYVSIPSMQLWKDFKKDGLKRREHGLPVDIKDCCVYENNGTKLMFYHDLNLPLDPIAMCTKNRLHFLYRNRMDRICAWRPVLIPLQSDCTIDTNFAEENPDWTIFEGGCVHCGRKYVGAIRADSEIFAQQGIRYELCDYINRLAKKDVPLKWWSYHGYLICDRNLGTMEISQLFKANLTPSFI